MSTTTTRTPPIPDYRQFLTDFSHHDWISYESRIGLARIASLAMGLGLVAGVHLAGLTYLSLVSTLDEASREPLRSWCLYVCSMCLYHSLEFFITARFHPETVNYDSFLVNQSLAFQIAVIAGWAEFWLEFLLLPWEMKSMMSAVSRIGIVLVIIGQAFRSAAMITAGYSFTHLIAHERPARHELVTWGVYRYVRHPSYFGWFWWCIGTQLILVNPVSTVAYAVAAWHFFRTRVPEEELTLENFYPGEYAAYKRRTMIGIPFVR